MKKSTILKVLYYLNKYKFVIIIGTIAVLTLLGIHAPITLADDGCPPNPEPISG